MEELEFKGGLHSSCLRPWPFSDIYLEKTFQNYMFVSVLDRTRSACMALCYFLWPVRLTVIAVRLMSDDWAWKELALMLFRLFLQFLLSLGVFIDWSGRVKALISRAMIWLPRIGCMGVLAEQAGLYQNDSSILFFLLSYTLFVGLLIPSFREFVLCVSAVYMVKPFSILMTGSHGCPRGHPAPCPGNDFQTVLVQNICLLTVVIGVFYYAFSDARRQWLLSFEVFGQLNELGPAFANQIVGAEIGKTKSRCAVEAGALGAGEGVSTDEEEEHVVALDRDPYFSPEERAQQLETWQRERVDIAARDEEARAGPDQSWRAVGKLGGRVYKALDLVTGKRIALKVLPGGAAHCTFFVREARRARALAHPSLAAVLGGELRSGALCLAVEYCNGGSVQTLLQGAGGPLTTEAARELGRQAATGLAYLHRHQVLRSPFSTREIDLTH